ncbi:adenylate/guanylate cyclase domain-containing protein [Janthinobacterium sp. 17J80-10]|uniref:adenylate/guanylate cyclase domain-containing protein n=1 Tax=Janthinobacterium sp. 17J80-10 TaxID=2497863 RepID=UPI0010057A94|nr:adenylate/guanylate cyclase domain-containing protein [Janthinobacterium sp. 17J80-10]QAU35364.1 adenylate/guanylate cyclase domain-containing protein [Janthinobacterium sp. 17J80-10]
MSKTHEQLRMLLSERNQYPERAASIDRQIHQRFSCRLAPLVLDMCGFSQMTAEHGVIHFLAMVRQMEEAACPAVLGNGGQVVKQEADNLFAAFAEPAAALEAALDILRSAEAMNAVLPAERAVQVSIGIGYGDTLLIEGEDMFGHEMNVACKLGEDVAGRKEILLSAAAFAALPQGRYACEAASTFIGDAPVTYYRFMACL